MQKRRIERMGLRKQTIAARMPLVNGTVHLRSLCHLKDLCATWGDHPFPHANISSPCSPENSRIDTNDGLRSHREFVCEDGQLRYFTWHIKHYKLNLRVHYNPDEQLRVVRICHIGSHLPTYTP